MWSLWGLGDNGWSKHAIGMLAGKARADYIENTHNTRISLQKLPGMLTALLKGGPIDIFHFNWGLDDVAVSAAHLYVPIDEYEANLPKLIAIMRNKMPNTQLLWDRPYP